MNAQSLNAQNVMQINSTNRNANVAEVRQMNAHRQGHTTKTNRKKGANIAINGTQDDENKTSLLIE